MPQLALVRQLNKERIDWRCEFRVVRKYRCPPYGHFPETLELCFMDKEGGKIQGTVNNSLIGNFDEKLPEGGLVAVTQFTVIDNSRMFPMTDSPFRIFFQKYTQVHPVERIQFPKTLFQFKSFSRVLSGGHSESCPLFDIIGEIVDIKDSKMKVEGGARRTNFVELLLEDLDGIKLPCLLWEPYCNAFRGLADFLRNGQRKQCVVIVQLCRTRMFKGGLGVSNTYNATKVHFMVDLDDMVEYRSRLPSFEHSRSYDGSQISIDQTLSAKEELEGLTTVVVSVKKLKEKDVPMRVWIVASVSDVIFDWDWCYTSCLQCKRKVVERDSKVFCPHCKSYVVGNMMYKIHVNVVDGSGCVTLLLWNDIAHQMIGEPASSVAEGCVVEKYRDDDVEIISQDVVKLTKPEPIMDLVGREFLFKLCVERKHIIGKDDIYHVEKVSEDKDLRDEYRITDHELPGGDSEGHKCRDGDTGSDVDADDVDLSDEEFPSPVTVIGRKRTCVRGRGRGSASVRRRRLVVMEDDEDADAGVGEEDDDDAF